MIARRYLSKPRMAPMPEYVEGGPDAENYLARTVHEADGAPRPTGLMDAQGNELC